MNQTSDIKLDDLLNSVPKQQQVTNPQQEALTPVQEIAKVEETTRQFSPEDRKKIEAIKASINLQDTVNTLQYGVQAQKEMTDFSNHILSGTRSCDSGYVGELLNNVLHDVQSFRADDSEKSFWQKLPFVNKVENRIAKARSSYQKLSVQIERVQIELDKAVVNMLKDIKMFDNMYDKNLNYFKQVELYIQAGEEEIAQMRETVLPRLKQEAANSNNPMAEQVVRDFESKVNRFEQKIHNMKISKTVAIQTAPQIRLLQNNDKSLVEQIQDVKYNVIPIWKNQMVMSLGLMNQERVVKLNQRINDTTNELLKRNSEMLKNNSIEVAKANERSIVDIETLQKVNDDLISAIQETIKIQEDGRQKRQEAEASLVKIEEQLKEALLQNSSQGNLS